MRRIKVLVSIAVLTAVLFSALPAPSASVSANSGIVVNTHQDSFSLNNDGICSLREAITIANQGLGSAYGCSGGSGGANTITFAGNYTITLGSQLPAVTSTIIIQGNGASNTIIQANAAADTAAYRVFNVTTGSLTLDGLTVRHGRCENSCLSGGGGGIYNAGTLTVSNVTISNNSAFSGGGIYNNSGSHLTLTNVTFSGNSAGYGGGMHNSSSTMLTNVTFSGNSAGYGGGMYNTSHPTLTNVTFSANSASYHGGGMYNTSGSPTLTNVTFSANSASQHGGGMYNTSGSHPTLTNVTFSANYAESGGGLYNDSSAALRNVTFYTNLANHGGGIYNHGSSPLTLTNVIIANSLNGDCVTSSSLNIASSNNLMTNSGSNACGLIHGANGNIIGQNPNLGAIADNGGFTQTHALLAGSPAIDAGTNTGCPATDQRGVSRPQGASCDIGAVEFLVYTVIFNVQGGAPNPASQTVVPGGLAAQPAAPTRAGHTFNGWFTASTGGILWNFATDAITNDITLYAQWTIETIACGQTFPDVSNEFWACVYIERLANAGITSGFPDGTFKPTQAVTRGQMAVFLLKAINFPAAYSPPDVEATFSDTDSHWAKIWIEALKASGITGGFADGTYRPENPVTRAQMAIFLLKALNGPGYTPPPAAPTFDDTAEHWASDWIEALRASGLTGGYPDGTFRPDNPVTRAEMAVFIVNAFGLP